jgi:tetratricopeptide (TPR) repeat protein
MQRGRVLLAAALSLAPCAGVAGEPHDDKLHQWVKQAEHFYQTGKYREAAALLEQAYQLEPDPRLLYNIARARDQAGDLREAADYYQRYMASAEGSDPQLLKRAALALERVRGLIDREEAEKKRQEAERQRMELEHHRAEAEARAAQERASAEAEAARRAQEEAEARNRVIAQAQIATRAHERIGAYALGGVGVLAIGTGIVFGVRADSSYGAFKNTAQTATAKDSFASQTRNNALAADIGYGIGAAALATAVILFPKGTDPQIAVAPTPNGFTLAAGF